MRTFWIILGVVSLAIGIVGLFLPFLPTAVFLIAAAFCFARSSRKLHDWLLAHPILGPPITDWHRSGAINRRAKWFATLSILLSLGLTVLFGLGWTLLALQAAILTGVLIFIWTRPDY